MQQKGKNVSSKGKQKFKWRDKVVFLFVVSQTKAALLSLGRKWICFSSNFKIEQPFQKFLCTWAITHPPQYPGPRGKGSRSPTITLP